MTDKKLPKTYTMEERLEKLISGCSNTNDLSGECYPMYGVYDLVEEFINDELVKARAEAKEQTLSALCKVLNARGISVPDIASLVEEVEGLTKKE